MIASVCVFCGASSGSSRAYLEAAGAFGREIARRGLRLVYGGGDSGVMGAVARSAFSAGAEVVGIIPRKLHALVAEADLTELIVVEDMRERKARMHELSDAFAALPGGIGTLEEFFEAWTWLQLGFHAKPVALFDVGGFWQPLVDMVDHMVAAGFLASGYREQLIVADTPDGLLGALNGWPAPSGATDGRSPA